jgi:hypothetical protein
VTFLLMTWRFVANCLYTSRNLLCCSSLRIIALSISSLLLSVSLLLPLIELDLFSSLPFFWFFFTLARWFWNHTCWGEKFLVIIRDLRSHITALSPRQVRQHTAERWTCSGEKEKQFIWLCWITPTVAALF